jgi:hypothetical protein
MSEVARTLQITVVGGSIPERSGDKLYNTCCIFGSDGKLKGKHRKVLLKTFLISQFIYIQFIRTKKVAKGKSSSYIYTGSGIYIYIAKGFQPRWLRLPSSTSRSRVRSPDEFRTTLKNSLVVSHRLSGSVSCAPPSGLGRCRVGSCSRPVSDVRPGFGGFLDQDLLVP